MIVRASERASERETEGESQNRGRSEGGPARVGVVVLSDRDSRSVFFAVAVVTVVCVALSRSRRRYPYEGVCPLFRRSPACAIVVRSSRNVFARACGGKKFRGSCRRGKIGESRAAKVRECADRSTTRLQFRSRSMGRLLQQRHRYVVV